MRQSQGRKGPDILVFIWPGEFGFVDFSGAQRNASRSAEYLSALLGRMTDRKLYLVAHSLGSKVLMEGLSGLPVPAPRRPVAGVLLVAGAIPATSVRNWSQTVTTRFPAAELQGRSAETGPVREHTEGTGEYVAAASRAEHLVVTVASGDSVLGQLYSIDRLLAGASTQPLVPPSLGAAPRTLPQNLAIGSPFPGNPIFVRFDQELKDPTVGSGRIEREKAVPRLQGPDPSRVIMSIEWRFDFHVPHPSYHELVLADIQWRPLVYWHAPLNDPTMRREIVARAWALFDAPARSPAPARPAAASGS